MATLAGYPPDPEQRMLLDAAFALDKDGKSVAFEVAVVAPRQNLKTGFFKQVALGQLFVRHERLVVWSAHEFDTAKEAMNDLEALIDGSDILRKRIRLTAKNNVASHGAVPEIRVMPDKRMKDAGIRYDARLKVKTRTPGGGRGLSGRKVLLDEGYALQAGQVGALMPIMLAQPDPQVYVGSSACRPESAVLWDIVQRGRAGGDPRMVYAEWCAPPPEDVCADGDRCDHAKGRPGCACDDQDLLVGVHSAITRGRILLETVADLRKTMPPEEYGREVMGWHDEPDEYSGIPVDLWETLTDAESTPTGVVAFALDMNPEQTMAAITVAGHRADGLPHVEITGDGDGRLDYRRDPTRWAPARLVELVDEWEPCAVVVARDSPAMSLVPDLERAGLRVTTEPRRGTRDVLVLASGSEVTQACGSLYNLVRTDGMRHLGQAPLADAVEVARRRDRGDGTWRWSRVDSGDDICSLVSATESLWGLATYGTQEMQPFAIVD